MALKNNNLKTTKSQYSTRLASSSEASVGSYLIPIHLQLAYTYLQYNAGDLPVTEKLANQTLSLPMFSELSDGDVKMVVDSLKKSIEA